MTIIVILRHVVAKIIIIKKVRTALRVTNKILKIVHLKIKKNVKPHKLKNLIKSNKIVRKFAKSINRTNLKIITISQNIPCFSSATRRFKNLPKQKKSNKSTETYSSITFEHMLFELKTALDISKNLKSLISFKNSKDLNLANLNKQLNRAIIIYTKYYKSLGWNWNLTINH